MTGFVGGWSTGRELRSLADSLYQEDWYRTRRVEHDGAGIAIVEHGDRDAASNALWEGDDGIGMIYGVLSSSGPFAAVDEVFEALPDRPAETLSTLEGPFVLAYIEPSSDRVLLATDKAGSRPCYHTDADTFAFSSELKSLVGQRPDPTVDVDGVSDLLLMGYVIGTNTLVDNIHNLPPATLLEYDGTDVELSQYWKPVFDRYRASAYPECWIQHFSTAVENVVNTVDGRLGLWLSGGIDSRVTATELANRGTDFETFTYANERGRNLGIAVRVASQLGVNNTFLAPGTPEQFITGIKQSVDATDGMIAWEPFVNLSSLFQTLHDRGDVVMEGGTFMGEDVWLHSLRDDASPIERIYEKKHVLPRAAVRELLAEDAALLESLEEDIDRTGFVDKRKRTLYGMRRLYSYSHMRSNIVQRSQVGTRDLSHGPVLDVALGIPDDDRMKTIPFTNGHVPAAVPKLKLKVSKALDAGVDRIPYERTMVAPSVPYLGHVVGFGASQFLNLIRLSPPDRYTHWYRTDDHVQQFIDELLESVSRRPFLDKPPVEALRRDVLQGERDDITPISALTGLELWIQEYLD